ncbi:hypothetical protein F511_04140 [Dorcoceras hygrometricum]|nr:hypothetical protein F511_04140 [Dorcoceras hygrometricum]
MEEASKMMAEGILAYVKAVVSHTTQSTNQGSFQHKGIEQGAGSSRAGKTRRSAPTSPGLEERYTPPHRRDEAVFHRSSAMVKGNGNGNPRPHLQQPYSVTNPINQHGLYEEGMGFGNTDLNADNGAYQARGAQFYNHPLQNRNAEMINRDMVRETVQELYGPALRVIGHPEFNKPDPDVIDNNNPYPRGYKIPDFSLFSGEDGQSIVENIARFTIKCGTLANLAVGFDPESARRVAGCFCKNINAMLLAEIEPRSQELSPEDLTAVVSLISIQTNAFRNINISFTIK